MMNLTSNGNSNGNGGSRPYLKVALLVFAVVLVGWLLYRQIGRSYGPVQTVWVAADDLSQGTMISADHIRAKKMRQKSTPEGSLLDPGAILGRQIDREKLKGASFRSRDFTVRRASAKPITDLVPEGRVMMTVRFGAKAAPVSSLVQGDRMDILAAGGAGSIVARDAYMIGTIGSKKDRQPEKKNTVFGVDLTPPTLQKASAGGLGVLLGIKPEDVFTLAQAQASGVELNVVLHGRAELADGNQRVEIESPLRNRPAAVELIAGSKRQQVVVQR